MGNNVLVLLFGTLWLGGIVYCVLGVIAARKFARENAMRRGVGSSAAFASLLKPLSGIERGLEQNLESFFLQDYPNYEILFAVNRDDDPALDVVERLRCRYPERDVQVIVAESPYPNAKVYSMQRMAAKARGQVLVISDSDVRVTPGYLRAVMRPFENAGTGVVTCLYRGTPGATVWSRLEALGMSARFIPGVLVAWLLETKRLDDSTRTGLRFALGPTMAVSRECLDAIGGFQAMSHYLADDFILGKWAEERGYRVELSPYVLDHLVLGESFAATALHQLRWERSSRSSRPVGYLGEGFTHPTAWAVAAFAALALSGSPVTAGIAMIAGAIAARIWVSWAVGWDTLRDVELRRSLWLIPVTDLVGFAVWLGGFTGRTIIWRGVEYRVGRDGRFEPLPVHAAEEFAKFAEFAPSAELDAEPLPEPSEPVV